QRRGHPERGRAARGRPDLRAGARRCGGPGQLRRDRAARVGGGGRGVGMAEVALREQDPERVRTRSSPRWSVDVSRYGAVLIGLAGLIIVLSVTQDGFLTVRNLFNVLQTNAALLICSVGMTFVVLLGGFDLSVGGFLALGAVILAKLPDGGLPAALAVVVVLAVGLAASALTNATFVALLALNFFVVTIATDALFSGLALVLTDGRTLPMYENDFIVWLRTG